jgi:hypothetical protein
LEQHVRPRWRERWRASLFHVLATAATTSALAVLGGLAVVVVVVLGGAGDTLPGSMVADGALADGTVTDGTSADGDAVAARLLAVVPVMVITGTGLGLAAGVLSAPWGIRRPADWTRPVVAGLIGAFHLAGRLERARFGELPFGIVEVAVSLAVVLALWTAIALATVLGGHRGTGPPQPTGRAWRETIGAAALFLVTIGYLGVRA